MLPKDLQGWSGEWGGGTGCPQVPAVEEAWPRDTSRSCWEQSMPQVEAAGKALCLCRRAWVSNEVRVVNLEFAGPRLPELNPASRTSAWFLLPPVNPESGHLLDQ